MNENTSPEVNAAESEETVTVNEDPVEIVTQADEIVEEATEVTENISESEPAEETVDDINASASDTGSEVLESGAQSPEGYEPQAEPDIIADESAVSVKKKKRFIQIPVIISACILVAALLAYFIFTGFFLREPEGVIWSNEIEGVPYYYEFNSDGTFKAYVGSIEVSSTYQKTKDDDGNTLTVATNIGNFYGNIAATYEISGSRLLGNQILSCSYGEGYDFALDQVGSIDNDLELPADFVPDEDLVGSWIFQYFGYDFYKATFNEDGSMSLEFVQDGLTYNGTYTIDGSTLNFTYYLNESVATPIEYAVDGDSLSFMGYSFVREGTEATADQLAISLPQ